MSTHHDHTTVMDLLQGNRSEREEGIRVLFELQFIRQYAFYWYRRYLPRIARRYDGWEDFYVAAIVEVVNEVEEGRGPYKNLKGYVSKLCQNLCEKALREFRNDDAFDIALEGLLADGGAPKNKLIDWFDNILKKMECKCQSLLRWRYLQKPPLKEKEDLAKMLNEECGSKKKGGEGYSPNAIPVHLHDCRDKFRGLAGDPPFGPDDF